MENNIPPPDPNDPHPGLDFPPGQFPAKRTEWHHAPPHLDIPGACYIITGATLHHKHMLTTPERLSHFRDTLIDDCRYYKWQLRAYAVMSNHYHIIVVNESVGNNLSDFIKHLYSTSARWLNAQDATPGRKVWFQYRDKCLDYKASYYARLNYVLNNPVHHGLVSDAAQYAWCSKRTFDEETERNFQLMVAGHKFDNVGKSAVPDDFNPVMPKRVVGTEVPQ